ncbi:MAG TPA: TIGR02265 family protein [Gemmatimonadaceae bacterium]|nr:TIGR02265 family protein [Gemmatimonadaceae bacterium]
MQQIKGAALRARLTFVEQHFGKDGVERVLDTLSEADRRTLKLVLPALWFPFDLGRRVDDAIVRVLGAGRPDFFERIGEASAEQNLSTVHASFLSSGDPHAFLRKAPVIYRTYYESGRREYEQTGPTSGVLTTHDAPTPSAPDCLTVVGWHRRALQMCGARDVHVIEEECRASGGRVCRYRLSWR